MPRYSAHFVFPVVAPPLRQGVVRTDEGCVVKELLEGKKRGTEEAMTEFHSGVLIPGLVVACRLDYRADEEEMRRVSVLLRGRGVRAALLTEAGGKAFWYDPAVNRWEALSSGEVTRMREYMVEVKMRRGELPAARTFFPVSQEGSFRGREHFEERLRRLTLEGALAAGMEEAGAFRPDMRPGVVVAGVDFRTWEVRTLRTLCL